MEKVFTFFIALAIYVGRRIANKDIDTDIAIKNGQDFIEAARIAGIMPEKGDL